MSYDDGDVVSHEHFLNGLQWKLVGNKNTTTNVSKKSKDNTNGIFLCSGGHVPRRLRCKESEGRLCDNCNSEISRDSFMFRCMACDWDYCEKCGPDVDGKKEDACTRIGLLIAIQRRQREAMRFIRQARKTNFGNSFVVHKYESALSRLQDSNNTEALGGNDTNQHRCMRCKGTGVLLCCDGCPNAIHLSCAGLCVAPPGKWFCKLCKKTKIEERRWKRICGLSQ